MVVTDKYLALFNTRSKPDSETHSPGAAGDSIALPVKLSELGFADAARIRNLWTHQDLGLVTNEFAPVIHFHGAELYRLTPVK